MNNKELIKKLNQLESVQLDESWKENNRAVLFNQISSSDIPEEAYLKEKLVKNFLNSFIFFKKHILTPAWAGAIILVFLISSGIVVQASGDARPGSFFYYARLIKEGTQLASTFDKKEKNKLNLKFASEHAKDITDVLNDPGFNKEGDAEKLAKNFEDSLESVKTSLKEMRAESEKDENKNIENNIVEGQEDGSVNKDEDNSGTSILGDENKNDEDKIDEEIQAQNEDQASDENVTSEEGFFVVDSGRGEEGLSVFDPSEGNSPTDNSEEGDEGDNEDGLLNSSSSDNISDKIETAEDISQNKNDKDLAGLIGEAEFLFEQEKYEEAREKIEEFMNIIDGTVSEGEVKGAATTAPENISETGNSTSSQE